MLVNQYGNGTTVSSTMLLFHEPFFSYAQQQRTGSLEVRQHAAPYRRTLDAELDSGRSLRLQFIRSRHSDQVQKSQIGQALGIAKEQSGERW